MENRNEHATLDCTLPHMLYSGALCTSSCDLQMLQLWMAIIQSIFCMGGGKEIEMIHRLFLVIAMNWLCASSPAVQ